MPGIYDGWQDFYGGSALGAEEAGEVFVAGHDHVGGLGNGAKSPAGSPLFDSANGPAVIHHGIIDVEKELLGVLPQKPDVDGIEQFSLKDHCIVFDGAFQQFSPRENGARADMDIERYGRFGQSIAQRFDTQAEGGLTEIIGDYHDFGHDDLNCRGGERSMPELNVPADASEKNRRLQLAVPLSIPRSA